MTSEFTGTFFSHGNTRKILFSYTKLIFFFFLSLFPNSNQCATSIFDLHRSCPGCSFELCLSCSREIRQGRLSGGPDITPHRYNYRGHDYCHGGKPLPRSSTESTDTIPTLSVWIVNDDGSIPCPSKDRGGCGDQVLELRRLLPKSWIQNLETRAKLIAKSEGIQQTLASPLKNVNLEDFREKSSGNCLYRPSAREMLAPDGIIHFRKHWANGEPVVVRETLAQTLGLSWEPMVMSRALCENMDSNIKAVDCLTNCEVKMLLHPLPLEIDWIITVNLLLKRNGLALT